jgi:hypothetical protein
MKKHLLLLILAASVLTPAYAQKFKLGVTTTLWGDSDPITWETVDGAGHANGRGFYNIGVTGLFQLSPRWEFETGIEYSKHTMVTTPPGFGVDAPTPYRIPSIHLITIPATMQLNIWKYFFINGGLFLDIETSSSLDSQTGVGAMLGFGAKYDFKFGGTVFVNPYARHHALMPFAEERFHNRLLENGLRVGFMYTLK